MPAVEKPHCRGKNIPCGRVCLHDSHISIERIVLAQYVVGRYQPDIFPARRGNAPIVVSKMTDVLFVAKVFEAWSNKRSSNVSSIVWRTIVQDQYFEICVALSEKRLHAFREQVREVIARNNKRNERAHFGVCVNNYRRAGFPIRWMHEESETDAASAQQRHERSGREKFVNAYGTCTIEATEGTPEELTRNSM